MAEDLPMSISLHSLVTVSSSVETSGIDKSVISPSYDQVALSCLARSGAILVKYLFMLFVMSLSGIGLPESLSTRCILTWSFLLLGIISPIVPRISLYHSHVSLNF